MTLARILLASCIALTGSMAAAQIETAPTPAPAPVASPMINLGNWEIAGEGNYFRSNEGDYRQLTLSPKLEYFILNRFSVGGRVLFQDDTRTSTSFSFGPSLTWYFTHTERTAFYVDQSILWVNPAGSADNYFSGESGVGIDYFLAPNVAVGPSLRGVYYFNGDSTKPDGGLVVRFALSVLL